MKEKLKKVFTNISIWQVLMWWCFGWATVYLIAFAVKSEPLYLTTGITYIAWSLLSFAGWMERVSGRNARSRAEIYKGLVDMCLITLQRYIDHFGNLPSEKDEKKEAEESEKKNSENA